MPKDPVFRKGIEATCQKSKFVFGTYITLDSLPLLLVIRTVLHPFFECRQSASVDGICSKLGLVLTEIQFESSNIHI